MKALVFHRPGRVEVNAVDDPEIEQPDDVILRVTSTAICGSDLHIYDGFFPQVKDLVLGHEFMGIVEEIGSNVTNLRKGDRVVVPFPIACGACFFCNHQLSGHCENSNPNHYGPEGGKIRLDDIITHRWPLSKASEAYEIFNEKKDNCVKVVLKP